MNGTDYPQNASAEQSARLRAETFVAQVRSAMLNMPVAHREELTAGLVDHVLEIGDDGRRVIDGPLDPAAYASELASSAPGSHRAGVRRPPVVIAAGVAVLAIGGAWLANSLDQRPTPHQTSASASASVAEAQVPDVFGLGAEDARTTLVGAGFAVTLIEAPADQYPYVQSGTVVETQPFGKTMAQAGTDVLVIIKP
ncbi:MAG TPA: PASTA domain-containing protein [Propionicimonas sp.]|jgi:hypothetical protein